MTKIIICEPVGGSDKYLKWLLDGKEALKIFDNMAQAMNHFKNYGFNGTEIASFNFHEIREG